MKYFKPKYNRRLVGDLYFWDELEQDDLVDRENIL